MSGLSAVKMKKGETGPVEESDILLIRPLYCTLTSISQSQYNPVGLEQRGPEKYFQVFSYYGQKNIFVDLHVSGNSKTFSPLYFFFQNFEIFQVPF